MKINEVVVQFYELQCEIQFTVEKMNSPCSSGWIRSQNKEKECTQFFKTKSAKI